MLLDPGEARPVDWVLTTTKTYDTEGAARWIQKLVGPETRLVVIQNGVEHLTRFAGLVPLEQTVPCIVDIPAERSAPETIRIRRYGAITAPSDPNGRAFIALFDGSPFDAKARPDFLTAIWQKLAWNSPAIVNALTGKPMGVVRMPRIAPLMRGIVTECVAVGRAAGAQLPDGIPEEAIARYQEADPDSVNSFLADRLAGRRTEVDARNGVIIRKGNEYGIPTPLNEIAFALFEAQTV